MPLFCLCSNNRKSLFFHLAFQDHRLTWIIYFLGRSQQHLFRSIGLKENCSNKSIHFWVDKSFWMSGLTKCWPRKKAPAGRLWWMDHKTFRSDLRAQMFYFNIRQHPLSAIVVKNIRIYVVKITFGSFFIFFGFFECIVVGSSRSTLIGFSGVFGLNQEMIPSNSKKTLD